MQCGQLLRDFRRGAGLSQRQLAELVGVQRETVARWETGERHIDTEKLTRVATVTGISPRALRPDLADKLWPGNAA